MAVSYEVVKSVNKCESLDAPLASSNMEDCNDPGV